MGTAVAAEDSTLLELCRTDLEALLQRMPELTRGLLDYLTQTLASLPAMVDAVSRNRPDLAAHASPDGTVTLMFTHMCGSTELLTGLGDLEARRLFDLHDEIVRTEVSARAGFEVEKQGDGFVIAFRSARDGVLSAIAIQRRLASLRRERDRGIDVRIGLHTGEVIKEADKFFGLAVVLASRIAGEARPGEILVSSVVHELKRTAGDLHFGPPSTVALKGIARPQSVLTVEWLPAP